MTRHRVVLTLLVVMTACAAPAPSPPGVVERRADAPVASLSCAAGAVPTAVAVVGVASASISNGLVPVEGARVRLFIPDDTPADAVDTRELVAETITNAAGRYCLYLPFPTDDSGATGPGGQAFELVARKDGYAEASRVFRFAYSVWDYGGPTVDLELVPAASAR